MRNSILNKNKSASWMNFLVVCLFFIGFNAMAQGPGCPNIDAGEDVEIVCYDDCTELTATYLQTGQTTNYNVTAIAANSPFPTTGGNSVSVNTDDVWSDAINLPFDFCFYGQNYSQMLVGSNGVVTFDLNSNTPGGGCAWSFTNTLPSPNLFLATIFGPYMDINPAVQGSGTINWTVSGTAPCRTMVVSYPNVPYYSCNNLSMTTQIVLYETTNVVEVYLGGRSNQCSNWNNGNAVLGIQNQNGTSAVVAPGRNTGNWASNGEAWRFTPSGAPNVDITWYDGNGNVVGNEPTITVCPEGSGDTYRVVADYTDCDGNVVSVNDAVEVTVLEDDFDNADFFLNPEPGSDYSIWVQDFDEFDQLNAVHEWYVLSSPNPTGGPYTPILGTTSTGPGPVFLIGNAQNGLYYTVVHKVITECGEICYAQVQYQEEGKGVEGQNHTFAAEVDCCIVFDYWPNGPGEPMDFTAKFDMALDFNDNILTQVENDYGNNPSIMHEWFLLTSPNPNGGPYTLVDYQTGVDYTFGPIEYEIYYFLIHRVKSECGEVCYGQSICRNCGPLLAACDLCEEFDCALLDEILPPCDELVAPTNLQVQGDTLTWDPVPGALTYIVSSPGGTDPQIACNCHGQISIVPLETDTNSVVLPIGLQSQCFVWMVTAVCYDGTTSDPSNQECYFPIRGTEKESTFENAEIAPNPSNGNMTFVVETTYDTEVTIDVFDFYGKRIQTFVEQLSAHTEGTIDWDASGKLARGIYIVSFKTDKETIYKKIIVD